LGRSIGQGIGRKRISHHRYGEVKTRLTIDAPCRFASGLPLPTRERRRYRTYFPTADLAAPETEV
jgi:hypothetical protein